MKKVFLFLSLCWAMPCMAQTPSRNLMPDGSFDSYLGAGVITRPVYEGAIKNKRNLFPSFQIELSNGLYVAGMSTGWHLSETPGLEYGPLLQIEPGRTPQGIGNSIDTPAYQTASVMGPDLKLVARPLNRLDGMTDIKTRLLAGGFTHFRINENFRVTNSLLYGAGNNKHGLRLTSDLNYRFTELPRHHSLAVAVGLNMVNQAYAESYFGVSEVEAGRSINEEFHPKSGVKDFHLDINWNYSLSSAWIITSKLRATQLVGSVKESPLVEKKSAVSVSTALAYRF